VNPPSMVHQSTYNARDKYGCCVSRSRPSARLWLVKQSARLQTQCDDPNKPQPQTAQTFFASFFKKDVPYPCNPRLIIRAGSGGRQRLCRCREF
jgi:hypothetical protein